MTAHQVKLPDPNQQTILHRRLSTVVMDYAFLNGRMTRQAVKGIERMAADAPVLIDRLVTSALNIRWAR
jgi:hypothetical protein